MAGTLLTIVFFTAFDLAFTNIALARISTALQQCIAATNPFWTIMLETALYQRFQHPVTYLTVALLVVGAGLALSSSAFVLQLLRDRGELGSRHGRAALGILLFQDLAAVPLLVTALTASPPRSELRLAALRCLCTLSECPDVWPHFFLEVRFLFLFFFFLFFFFLFFFLFFSSGLVI